MNNHSIIINVGRQIGSGGGMIARKLAEEFGCTLYDKELLNLAAKESGFSERFFEENDEQKGFFKSLFHVRVPLVNENNYYHNNFSQESLYQIQSDAIRKAADNGNCVFVGRTADYILRDYKNVVNIFITADLAQRVERVCRRQNLTIEEAQKYVHKREEERASYYNYYTGKQWGVKPNEIDPAVTARVPVILTEKDGYFTDEYQAMPKDGYTELFKKMLDHPNIDIRLQTLAKDCLKLEEGKIFFECSEFDGDVIFTGMTDELFDLCFGALPYRSLRFDFSYHDEDSFQPEAVVNYTVDEEFTRITEFKKMTGRKVEGTTIMKEYSLDYSPDTGLLPYYAILNDENKALYEKYANLAKEYKNLHLLGRLAEYKYYNMDAITEKALELCERMV